MLAQYRRLDDQLGPRRLPVPVPVQATLDMVDYLRKDASPSVHQTLLSLSAQYEQLTGWLWTDSGDHALAGYVLARKSEQTRYEGRTDTAVELARAAQRSEWRSTASVTSTRTSWTRPPSCSPGVPEAAGPTSPRGSPTSWRSSSRCIGGICLTDLGEVSPAIEVFDHALAALPADRIRDRAYYLACSAQPHIGNGDPEQAAPSRSSKACTRS